MKARYTYITEKSKFRFTIGRDSDDVEKLVLPSIVFVNTSHREFKESKRKGFMLIFGWWDFSISFGFLK